MPEADVARLIQFAKPSRSAFNMHNYRFVLVLDAALRQQIRAVDWNQAQVTDASLPVIMCADLSAHNENPARHWSHAPKAVQNVLVPALTPFSSGKRQLIRDEAMRSTGLAGMTLMLAARGTGIRFLSHGRIRCRGGGQANQIAGRPRHQLYDCHWQTDPASLAPGRTLVGPGSGYHESFPLSHPTGNCSRWRQAG